MVRSLRNLRKPILHDCAQCGYVVGAGTGFKPLDDRERQLLIEAGFELTTNVHGDEIARAPERTEFNTARAELHRVQCRPTIYEHLLRNELIP